MNTKQLQPTMAGEALQDDLSPVQRRIAVLSESIGPLAFAEAATTERASGSVAVANS